MGAAQMQDANTVRSGRLITGRAAGASVDFALALIDALKGREEAERIAKQIVCFNHKRQIDSLTPFDQQCSRERCTILEGWKPDKILIVRILLQLVNKFPISKAHTSLQNQRTKNHPARFGYVTCIRREHNRIK